MNSSIRSFCLSFLAPVIAALAVPAALAQPNGDPTKHAPGQASIQPPAYKFQFLSLSGFSAAWGMAINNDGTTLLLGAGQQGSQTFMRFHNGRLLLIDYPNSLATVALGLNSRGDVVGDVWPRGGTFYHGFVRLHSGAFTKFAFPGLGDPAQVLQGMQTDGINDSRVVVGGYALSEVDRGAFIRHRDGTFETFNYLGDPMTHARGINNLGQIVGQLGETVSFIREPDGTFTHLEVAGASSTQAFGINNRGQVVGLYYNGRTHGFFRDEEGTFHTLNVPGADATVISGINDFEMLVGTTYFGEQQMPFVATPIKKKGSGKPPKH